MKTIIIGGVLLVIAFFSIRAVIKVLSGKESGCSCGDCSKKGSCKNYDEKNYSIGICIN